jgi:hypothetical protein
MATQKHESSKAVEDVLFKPSAPSFADTYTTLISVVQGLALAALLMMIDKLFFNHQNGNFSPNVTNLRWLYVAKLGVCFLLICLIWHRYATANQYYSWPLGPFDAIIPFGFSVTQAVLCLSVPLAAHWFAWVLSGVSLCGVFAYCNTISHHDRPQVRELYTVHYDKYENGLGDFLYYEVKKYERAQLLHMVILLIVMFVIGAASFFGLRSDSELGWVSVSFALVAMGVEIFWFDFRRQLRISGKYPEYFSPDFIELTSNRAIHAGARKGDARRERRQYSE